MVPASNYNQVNYIIYNISYKIANNIYRVCWVPQYTSTMVGKNLHEIPTELFLATFAPGLWGLKNG